MSISAILAKAFSTTLLGMGTVFALLIVISLIIGWAAIHSGRPGPAAKAKADYGCTCSLCRQVMPQAACRQRAATITKSLPPLLLQPLPLMKQSMDRQRAATIT